MIYKFELEMPDFGGYSQVSFVEFDSKQAACRYACRLIGADDKAKKVWVSENVASDGEFEWQYIFSICL